MLCCQAIEAELAEEVEIDRLRKAEEKREEDEGIMRMPPMPGSEPLEKDKRDPGSTWFNEQQQALRSLRRREQVSHSLSALHSTLAALSWLRPLPACPISFHQMVVSVSLMPEHATLLCP